MGKSPPLQNGAQPDMTLRFATVCSGIEAASTATRHMRDLTGHRNGRLVAVSVASSKHGRAMWNCACDCGGSVVVQSNNLTRDAGTKSCGCLRSEAQRARLMRDGAWNDGKSYAVQGGDRCYKTRHSWAKAAIRKFGNKCERCGWSAARCDVHHKNPKAEGGLHTLSNAVVICPNCHRVEHEGAP